MSQNKRLGLAHSTPDVSGSQQMSLVTTVTRASVVSPLCHPVYPSLPLTHPNAATNVGSFPPTHLVPSLKEVALQLLTWRSNQVTDRCSYSLLSSHRKKKILSALKSSPANNSRVDLREPTPLRRGPQPYLPPSRSPSLRHGEILIEWKDGTVTPLFDNINYQVD